MIHYQYTVVTKDLLSRLRDISLQLSIVYLFFYSVTIGHQIPNKTLEINI